jgi:hypothetical protein
VKSWAGKDMLAAASLRSLFATADAWYFDGVGALGAGAASG